VYARVENVAPFELQDNGAKGKKDRLDSSKLKLRKEVKYVRPVLARSGTQTSFVIAAPRCCCCVVVVVVGMSEKLWWCKSGTLCPRRKGKKRTNKRGSGHQDGQLFQVL